MGCADRAVSAGVPGTHVHREQDPGRRQPALQRLLRQDGPRLERGQGAGGPGVPGSPQLCADPGLRRGALRGGGRGRGPPGDGQHGRHCQGVAGGQRLLPSDAAGPHRRCALPGAGHTGPHGLHGQHGCHRPRLGHPEWPAAARVPGAPGLRHLSGAGKPARVLGQRRQDGQMLAGRHRRARAHVHGPQTQRERPQVPRGHLTGQADPKPKGGGAFAALQSRLRPTRGASGPRLPTLTLRERTKDREEPRGDVSREPCVHSVHGQRGRPRARLRRPVRSAAEGVPRPRLRHQLHPGARPGALHRLARRRAAPVGRSRPPAAARRRPQAQPLAPLQQQGGLRRRRRAAAAGLRHPDGAPDTDPRGAGRSRPSPGPRGTGRRGGCCFVPAPAAFAEPPAHPSVPPGTLPRLSGSPAARAPGARGPRKTSLFLLSETDASKKARTGIFPWQSGVSDRALSRLGPWVQSPVGELKSHEPRSRQNPTDCRYFGRLSACEG
ncbi:WD repeat-containing protein 86 isoform X1 [Odocoileus virginianus]|uniref:WD repeat-containing protein 86 isoform X1 n=1 Tax=Odocoileus virginianus TaxID=9874 RepID=A0ABM4H184_ODOVR